MCLCACIFMSVAVLPVSEVLLLLLLVSIGASGVSCEPYNLNLM